MCITPITFPFSDGSADYETFKIRDVDYLLVPLMIGVNLQFIRDKGFIEQYKETIEYLLRKFPDDERLQHKYKVLIDNYFH